MRRGAAAHHAAECVLRPDARALQDINKAFAATGRRQTGQAVTIRQSHGGSGKQARSVIDGLEADVVTLALAYDIDAIAAQAQLLPADWQKRLPAQQRPLHVDDRVPGAQGQPEGHPRLGRPGAPGVAVITPNPEDLGRRALELPGRVGLRAAAAGRQRSRRREEFVARCIAMCRCSTPARAARRRPSSNAASATCCIAWENEALLALDANSARSASRSSIRRRASWPSRRSRWSIATSTGRAPVPSPRRTSSFSTRPTSQELIARHYFRATDPRSRRAIRKQFPHAAALHDRRGIRWLGPRAESPLRRRRRVRPDRARQCARLNERRAGIGAAAPQCAAGLRPQRWATRCFT